MSPGFTTSTRYIGEEFWPVSGTDLRLVFRCDTFRTKLYHSTI
jgi:hypothetical protein